VIVMAGLRHDPVSGRAVLIAAARADRPHTFASTGPDAVRSGASCPFCPGNEAMTPPEITRTGGAPGARSAWRARVFPNLYPITDAHEVVVLSPDHDRSFARLSDDQVVEVVQVLRDRVRVRLGEGLPYAVAFVNHRRAAGASLAHPHAQVVGLDFVPPEVAATRSRQEERGRDLVDVDLACAREHALVLDDGVTATWCPFASASPFQIRVVHPAAGPRFGDASDDVTAAVALAARDALERVLRTLNDPPYNLVFHTADTGSERWPRWHVEITPRLSIVAGFEQATGIAVNTLPPDRAVRDLLGT
jgi:UDPglucose--hexose-1-phosphate uridylyltransferase